MSLLFEWDRYLEPWNWIGDLAMTYNLAGKNLFELNHKELRDPIRWKTGQLRLEFRNNYHSGGQTANSSWVLLNSDNIIGSIGMLKADQLNG